MDATVRRAASSRLPRGAAGAALRVASRVQGVAHGFRSFGDDALIVPPYRIIGARRISVGSRTVIGPYAFVSVLGERRGERYDGVLRIADDTSIGQNFIVSCAGSIVIGARVLISSNVHIGDAIHGYDDPSLPIIEQPLTRGYVIVADDAFIGINAVVLPNVRIGRHAVVGAGAVVTHDVPDFCVAAGNPARVISRYDFGRRMWVRTRPAGAASSQLGRRAPVLGLAPQPEAAADERRRAA